MVKEESKSCWRAPSYGLPELRSGFSGRLPLWDWIDTSTPFLGCFGSSSALDTSTTTESLELKPNRLFTRRFGWCWSCVNTIVFLFSLILLLDFIIYELDLIQKSRATQKKFTFCICSRKTKIVRNYLEIIIAWKMALITPIRYTNPREVEQLKKVTRWLVEFIYISKSFSLNCHFSSVCATQEG